MTFHAGQGGNDYEHQGSSFTPRLSGNGGQPKNLKVGEANGCYQRHPPTLIKKMKERKYGRQIRWEERTETMETESE